MSEETATDDGGEGPRKRRLPDVPREVIERSKERIGETQEKAKEVIVHSHERTRDAFRRSRERTRGAIEKSRTRTREAADKARRTTRKVFDTGREDITSGARIIKDEVGPGAFMEDKRAYLLRVAKLGGPVAFLACWFMVLLWIRAINGGLELAFFSFLYLLPSPFGKETMIPASIAAGANPWVTALSFTFVDATLVTFVAFNFDYIMMIPNLGKVTRKVEQNSRKFLSSKPWVRDFAMAGLFAFVLLPFQGGGGATGAVIGRVMGLKPWRIIIPVIAGSALESFSMAFASETFLSFIPPWARYAGVAVLMVAVVSYFIASRRYAKKRADGDRPS